MGAGASTAAMAATTFQSAACTVSWGLGSRKNLGKSSSSSLDSADKKLDQPESSWKSEKSRKEGMGDRSQEIVGKGKGKEDVIESDKDEEEGGKEGAQRQELSISFEYQCGRPGFLTTSGEEEEGEDEGSRQPMESLVGPELIRGTSEGGGRSSGSFHSSRRSSSFSSFSAAAISANATLANTTLCRNTIGGIVLPGLDSPKNFRPLLSSCPDSSSPPIFFQGSSSPSSCSSPGSIPRISGPNAGPNGPLDFSSGSGEGNNCNITTAGGPAGEDRVQAVCCEESGWLFCGIYDGFNGRDAADYLAANLYRAVMNRLNGEVSSSEGVASQRGTPLGEALRETEDAFLGMVEGEMGERPELAMVGSCVLAVLLTGSNLHTVNLGDSRAVLATTSGRLSGAVQGLGLGMELRAVQLTEDHSVENERERVRVQEEHPEDPFAIKGTRVKGKLRVTKAFGAGYLKDHKFNDGLMGILRVRDLQSPPYIGSEPYLSSHVILPEDRFVVVGSDGLFDFFTNDDLVSTVATFLGENPGGDPAKFLVEQILVRAADNAGLTVEELKSVPIGRRRKYHDDVTVVVITLGDGIQTSSAST